MCPPSEPAPLSNTLAPALAGLAVGGALALAHFGGLWLTLGAWRERRPWTGWLLVSFLARAALVLVGFWLAARHSPVTLAAALATFALARLLLVRRVVRDPVPEERSWT